MEIRTSGSSQGGAQCFRRVIQWSFGLVAQYLPDNYLDCDHLQSAYESGSLSSSMSTILNLSFSFQPSSSACLMLDSNLNLEWLAHN